MTDALAKLSAATQALAEARTLDDVKQIHDMAQAAQVYARAAKLGLEAQNHAAEVKLRAERKAGELLAQLETKPGERTDLTSSNVGRGSEYRAVLEETGTTRQDANRWEQIAEIPEPVFEQHLEDVQAARRELTTTGALRLAKEQKREGVRQVNRRLVEDTASPIEHVAGATYQTIAIDPPWDWGDEGDVDQLGRARPVYDTMPIEEIAALPVSGLAQDNAHLYLWITNRSLPKGFALLEGWGFRYITALTWCKPHYGMGNYFRGSTEQVLFGVRGSLPLLRHDAGTWFAAERPGPHSGKPDDFYKLVETCSPGPWLEMFARQKRNGWASWGAEV